MSYKLEPELIVVATSYVAVLLLHGTEYNNTPTLIQLTNDVLSQISIHLPQPSRVPGLARLDL